MGEFASFCNLEDLDYWLGKTSIVKKSFQFDKPNNQSNNGEK